MEVRVETKDWRIIAEQAGNSVCPWLFCSLDGPGENTSEVPVESALRFPLQFPQVSFYAGLAPRGPDPVSPG